MHHLDPGLMAHILNGIGISLKMAFSRPQRELPREEAARRAVRDRQPWARSVELQQHHEHRQRLRRVPKPPKREISRLALIFAESASRATAR